MKHFCKYSKSLSYITERLSCFCVYQAEESVRNLKCEYDFQKYTVNSNSSGAI